MLRTLCLAVLLSALVIAQDKKLDVHLNHAFIVPDAETYEAIRNSEFVKQFAVWEERTTKRKDITYTGFYLYGRHTYFEFLKPDDPDSVGSANIMFGVDRTGDLELLQKCAEAAGVKTEIKTLTRGFNGKDVDWFHALDRKDPHGPSIGMYTMEYVPTFLHEWNPPMVELSGVRREDVLKRYAEVLKQWPIRKPVVDLVTIWGEMPEAGVAQSLRDCEVLGFITKRNGDTASCTKEGDVTIFLKAGSQPGITAMQFRLSGPAKNVPKMIGKTRVVVSETRGVWFATWSFR